MTQRPDYSKPQGLAGKSTGLTIYLLQVAVGWEKSNKITTRPPKGGVPKGQGERYGSNTKATDTSSIALFL